MYSSFSGHGEAHTLSDGW